jgi:hypothetical protein
MTTVDDHQIKHMLDGETRTLVSTGINKDGTPVSFTVKWRTEEEMEDNIAKTISAAEKLIAEHGKDEEEVYAGSKAENAISNVQRHRFLGIVATVGTFKNHEYDEGAIILGPIEITAYLKLTGGVRWDTLRIKRKDKDSKIHLGIGGATWARYVHFGKEKR